MSELTTERLEKRIKNCIEVGNGCVMLPVSVAEELLAYKKAAERLVRCKGRYHSEQNYRALAALFGVTIPDLPPLPTDEAPAQPSMPVQEIVGWIFEDELPKNYPYDAMFVHSKVDVVRMFPVFAPSAAQSAIQEQAVPVAYTDNRNLKSLQKKGCATALLWLERNSEISDIPLYTEVPAQPVIQRELRSFVTDSDIAALHRFAECCDDPESGGHDLEKEQVQRLEKVGALQRSGRISYITDFGDYLISATAPVNEQQNEPQNIPENITTQPVGELRARAISLYKPPFKFDFGYIWDADGQMVADQKLDEEGQILRVRGWGRISYLENPEALQDEVGEVIALALSDYWNLNI